MCMLFSLWLSPTYFLLFIYYCLYFFMIFFYLLNMSPTMTTTKALSNFFNYLTNNHNKFVHKFSCGGWSQPFHILQETPWPLILSFTVFFLLGGGVVFFHGGGGGLLPLSALTTLLTLVLWIKDIFRESSFEGGHTLETMLGFKWGMAWFISSEVFFFVSFFWAFFHFSLSPDYEVGSVWPPLFIVALGPFAVPLLNTIVLIGSGATFTWAHHSTLGGELNEAKMSLLSTIILGLYFTALQVFEYQNSEFGFNDSVYGSIFFIATGFHGCHVLIGTLLLTICLFRLKMNHFSSSHHIGLEVSGWYWHFVDVVWLFLFSFIYWWGS